MSSISKSSRNKKRLKNKLKALKQKRKKNKAIKNEIDSISKEIESSLSNLTKIPKFPIIVVPKTLIQRTIDFDNCIILNNARTDNSSSDNDIIYDSKPIHIGRNIPLHDTLIKMSSVKRRKVCILSRLVDWDKMDPFHNLAWRHHISDTVYSYVLPQAYDSFDSHYVLIASICNERNKKKKVVHVDDDFMLDVMDNMKLNMKGDGNRHFNSHGNYHGFGVVAKYELNEDLSMGSFSDKKCKFLNKTKNNNHIFCTLYHLISCFVFLLIQQQICHWSRS